MPLVIKRKNQQQEVHMHKYMILVEVSSTAPLYGVDGLQTNRKLRMLGCIKANNSSTACSKVSEKLDISYDKLKAILYRHDDKGNLLFEQYTIE